MAKVVAWTDVIATDARSPEASFRLGGMTCLVVSEEMEVPARHTVGEFAVGNRRYRILVDLEEAQLDLPDILSVLSPRELEIALHVAAGSDCKMVARQLRISFHTVRVHLGRIYAKLGLHKQTELATLVASRFGGTLPPGK